MMADAKTEALQKINNLLNTPRGLAERAIDAAYARTFKTPAAVAERDLAARHFTNEAVRLIQTYDYDGMQAAVERLERVLRRIVDEKPAPPKGAAAIAAAASALAQIGWNGLEIEIASNAIPGDAGVVGFDARGIDLSGGRRLDRQELRTLGKPAYWSRSETWFSQFPKIASAGAGTAEE
jgi:hypothetical protein